MNCQIFSTGFNSGDFAGRGISVMLLGTASLPRHVPAGLVEQQNGVGAGRDGAGDLGQMERHGGRRTARQHQGGALAQGRADGTEDIGRAGALVVRRTRPRATTRPAAGDLVLLPDAGLVLEPDFYGLACGLARRDLRQDRGEVFLNADAASLSWA